MARAFSSGVPFPPNGGGVPPPSPVPPWPPAPLPSPLRCPGLGGGPSQVLGVSPHLLVHTAHEGRARLLGGWPPLPFWLGSCPILPPSYLHSVHLGRTLLGGSPLVVGVGMGGPPSVHAVRWDLTLLGGFPLLFLLLLAQGYPSLPLGYAVRWERTLPDGRVPPFLWDWSAHHRRARSVPFPLVCLLVCLERGVPPLLVWHAMR